MREITEKEHKSKQHLLESPSPQKVLDIPAQEFHTCIVKLSDSRVLFRPGFSTSVYCKLGCICLENIIQKLLWRKKFNLGIYRKLCYNNNNNTFIIFILFTYIPMIPMLIYNHKIWTRLYSPAVKHSKSQNSQNVLTPLLKKQFDIFALQKSCSPCLYFLSVH